MKRRAFIAGLGSAAAYSLGARAQRPANIPTIGFVYPGPRAAAPPRIAAFLAGLRAGGFREKDQVEIVPRLTDGDPAKLEPMIADLVERKVDLILAVSPAAVRAARSATKSIPIVAGDLESDPVASGFVESFMRPGGNVTGVFLDFPDLGQKWLELLKEALPQLSIVAVFGDQTINQMQLKAVEAAATVLNLKLALFEIRGHGDLDEAFLSIKRQGADALLMLSSPVMGGNTKLLAELTVTNRLPAVTLFTDFARDGGLMAYGPNLLAFFRQHGVVAAKVLHGANPADL